MKAVAGLCAVVVAAMLSGRAAADTSVVVSPFGCAAHGGATEVAAGSSVDVRWGWIARTAGLDRAFLGDVTVTATVDGNPVADTASYWSATAPFAPGWAVWWTYPVGTLAAGESVTVTVGAALTHPITDGFTAAQGGGLAPAGPLFGPLSCTITAA